MTNYSSNRTWLAQLQRIFLAFGRERHFAHLSQDREGAQKLTPIAKVLADAGRDSTTPAD